MQKLINSPAKTEEKAPSSNKYAPNMATDLKRKYLCIKFKLNFPNTYKVGYDTVAINVFQEYCY